MKGLGKIFFGVLCTVFLFACSHASYVAPLSQKDIVWVSTNKITVSWDPTTTHMNGSPITKNEGNVMYFLYVKEHDTDKEVLVEKYVNDTLVEATKPIPETSCEIRFEDEGRFEEGGRYLLGVQSGLYKFSEDKEIIDKPVFSPIAWSCNDNCTSNNPFGVKFIKKIEYRRK